VPVCAQLLAAAADAGEVGRDVDAYALLRIGNLCVGVEGDSRYDARRVVDLLVAGLARWSWVRRGSGQGAGTRNRPASVVTTAQRPAPHRAVTCTAPPPGPRTVRSAMTPSAVCRAVPLTRVSMV
jgi:hypothetical protein